MGPREEGKILISMVLYVQELKKLFRSPILLALMCRWYFGCFSIMLQYPTKWSNMMRALFYLHILGMNEALQSLKWSAFNFYTIWPSDVEIFHFYGARLQKKKRHQKEVLGYTFNLNIDICWGFLLLLVMLKAYEFYCGYFMNKIKVWNALNSLIFI